MYRRLRETGLNGFDHAAEIVYLVEVVETSVDHLLRQRFDVPAAAERVDRVYHAGFFGDDLLGPQGDKSRIVGWQREGLVVGISVKRLRAAENAGECLDGNARNVIQRLLDRERYAGSLRVKTHLHRPRILCPETLLHRLCPHDTSGTVFG